MGKKTNTVSNKCESGSWKKNYSFFLNLTLPTHNSNVKASFVQEETVVRL